MNNRFGQRPQASQELSLFATSSFSIPAQQSSDLGMTSTTTLSQQPQQPFHSHHPPQQQQQNPQPININSMFGLGSVRGNQPIQSGVLGSRPLGGGMRLPILNQQNQQNQQNHQNPTQQPPQFTSNALTTPTTNQSVTATSRMNGTQQQYQQPLYAQSSNMIFGGNGMNHNNDVNNNNNNNNIKNDFYHNNNSYINPNNPNNPNDLTKTGPISFPHQLVSNQPVNLQGSQQLYQNSSQPLQQHSSQQQLHHSSQQQHQQQQQFNISPTSVNLTNPPQYSHNYQSQYQQSYVYPRKIQLHTGYSQELSVLKGFPMSTQQFQQQSYGQPPQLPPQQQFQVPNNLSFNPNQQQQQQFIPASPFKPKSQQFNNTISSFQPPLQQQSQPPPQQQQQQQQFPPSTDLSYQLPLQQRHPTTPPPTNNHAATFSATLSPQPVTSEQDTTHKNTSNMGKTSGKVEVVVPLPQSTNTSTSTSTIVPSILQSLAPRSKRTPKPSVPQSYQQKMLLKQQKIDEQERLKEQKKLQQLKQSPEHKRRNDPNSLVQLSKPTNRSQPPQQPSSSKATSNRYNYGNMLLPTQSHDDHSLQEDDSDENNTQHHTTVIPVAYVNTSTQTSRSHLINIKQSSSHPTVNIITDVIDNTDGTETVRQTISQVRKKRKATSIPNLSQYDPSSRLNDNTRGFPRGTKAHADNDEDDSGFDHHLKRSTPSTSRLHTHPSTNSNLSLNGNSTQDETQDDDNDIFNFISRGSRPVGYQQPGKQRLQSSQKKAKVTKKGSKRHKGNDQESDNEEEEDDDEAELKFDPLYIQQLQQQGVMEFEKIIANSLKHNPNNPISIFGKNTDTPDTTGNSVVLPPMDFQEQTRLFIDMIHRRKKKIENQLARQQQIDEERNIAVLESKVVGIKSKLEMELNSKLRHIASKSIPAQMTQSVYDRASNNNRTNRQGRAPKGSSLSEIQALFKKSARNGAHHDDQDKSMSTTTTTAPTTTNPVVSNHDILSNPVTTLQPVVAIASTTTTCYCTSKTQCLSLHCACFKYGDFCSPTCQCQNCLNNSHSEANLIKRSLKIVSIQKRLPFAFGSNVIVVQPPAPTNTPDTKFKDDFDDDTMMLGWNNNCKSPKKQNKMQDKKSIIKSFDRKKLQKKLRGRFTSSSTDEDDDNDKYGNNDDLSDDERMLFDQEFKKEHKRKKLQEQQQREMQLQGNQDIKINHENTTPTIPDQITINIQGCRCKKGKCLSITCGCFKFKGRCGPHCSCTECFNNKIAPSQLHNNTSNMHHRASANSNRSISKRRNNSSTTSTTKSPYKNGTSSNVDDSEGYYSDTSNVVNRNRRDHVDLGLQLMNTINILKENQSQLSKAQANELLMRINEDNHTILTGIPAEYQRELLNSDDLYIGTQSNGHIVGGLDNRLSSQKEKEQQHLQQMMIQYDAQKAQNQPLQVRNHNDNIDKYTTTSNHNDRIDANFNTMVYTRPQTAITTATTTTTPATEPTQQSIKNKHSRGNLHYPDFNFNTLTPLSNIGGGLSTMDNHLGLSSFGIPNSLSEMGMGSSSGMVYQDHQQLPPITTASTTNQSNDISTLVDGNNMISHLPHTFDERSGGSNNSALPKLPPPTIKSRNKNTNTNNIVAIGGTQSSRSGASNTGSSGISTSDTGSDFSTFNTYAHYKKNDTLARNTLLNRFSDIGSLNTISASGGATSRGSVSRSRVTHLYDDNLSTNNNWNNRYSKRQSFHGDDDQDNDQKGSQDDNVIEKRQVGFLDVKRKLIRRAQNRDSDNDNGNDDVTDVQSDGSIVIKPISSSSPHSKHIPPLSAVELMQPLSVINHDKDFITAASLWFRPEQSTINRFGEIDFNTLRRDFTNQPLIPLSQTDQNDLDGDSTGVEIGLSVNNSYNMNNDPSMIGRSYSYTADPLNRHHSTPVGRFTPMTGADGSLSRPLGLSEWGHFATEDDGDSSTFMSTSITTSRLNQDNVSGLGSQGLYAVDSMNIPVVSDITSQVGPTVDNNNNNTQYQPTHMTSTSTQAIIQNPLPTTTATTTPSNTSFKSTRSQFPLAESIVPDNGTIHILSVRRKGNQPPPLPLPNTATSTNTHKNQLQPLTSSSAGQSVRVTPPPSSKQVTLPNSHIVPLSKSNLVSGQPFSAVDVIIGDDEVVHQPTVRRKSRK